MRDTALEKEIVDKGLTAPRVTLKDLMDNIVDTEILQHTTKNGSVLRWAILTLRNGFTATGKPAASVSAENDDIEIGTKIAIDNAHNELWPLMGYALAEKLNNMEK